MHLESGVETSGLHGATALRAVLPKRGDSPKENLQSTPAPVGEDRCRAEWPGFGLVGCG